MPGTALIPRDGRPQETINQPINQIVSTSKMG